MAGRNPLKSGQGFLLTRTGGHQDSPRLRRNPLKSGQGFLLVESFQEAEELASESQSPQIGSRFLTMEFLN